MEVLVDPTFDMEAAASAAVTATFVRERKPDKKNKGSSSCFFLKEDVAGLPDVSPESSSSIGSSGGSDDEEEDGVVSFRASGSLGWLGSLEDSLPIKRGLSNHYVGKSKSFGNLLDVSTVKEVEKAENPFNKRRILLANKWCRSRNSSFYSWQNPNSMPLLALNEDDEETPSTSSNDDNPPTTKSESQQSELKVTNKSQSCFSLTGLRVQDEPQ
ncbi:Exocyst subunit exo70 family protein G1 [Hibiscus syriacus]|uniref:Exocyst subunit exo70 family protein G1 n=1 Tax=Hibiscus syriacus TaxID=106335 RepID=A0A6A3CR20_HIBSY|nr:uncharacterized protein LOC120150328 [Hibiscus syriacus]KAE8731643.1 Exocyst subunit exo70 family protein G1 [Hibiscus syriacus]